MSQMYRRLETEPQYLTRHVLWLHLSSFETFKMKVMVTGFGVGLSWGGTILKF